MDVPKLLSLIRSCSDSKLLVRGKVLHQKVMTLGLQNNIPLCKNLMELYFSCQNYEHAELVFKTVEHPLDISLWNGLMAAYTKNRLYIEALELFQGLLRYPYLKPDCFTFPCVLKACGGLGRIRYGRILHAHLVKSAMLFDIVVVSTLVGLYAKCRLFEYATQLFDEMPEKDVASWNTVISCYYQDGRADKALELFEKMRESGFQPNSVTLTSVFSSCARLLDLERGKEIHREAVIKRFMMDDFVSAALVDMYGKCGCLEMARDVFEHMPRKTVVAWSSMIAGYSSIGDSKECMELFKRMIEEGTKPSLTTLSSLIMACSRSAHLLYGKLIHGYMTRWEILADSFVSCALIDLYFKCGKVQSAENIFDTTPRKNVICWNVMISGYVTVGNYLKALELYDDMQLEIVNPDAITFTTVLPACSQLAALEKGKEIHRSITESGLEANEKVMGAILDMYAKCGAVDKALTVFNQLPERDLVSWTSMITAYGSHGQATEALKLFNEMQQSSAKPDGVAFLAVLSACSHAGLVDEGYHYFNQMIEEYGIKPSVEHYSCLIDLLGRSGRLNDAYSILQDSSETRDDVGLLSTLFSACHLHKNLELGEKIAKLLIEKDSDDPSTYITLSNMYSAAKQWDEVRRVRLKMKELGLKKNPGCSWIEINKSIKPFFVEDDSNPQVEKVRECLAILALHMEKENVCLSEKFHGICTEKDDRICRDR